MTTQYTTLLGFALPVTGELSGTWGDTVNSSITQLEEDAIAGVATASVTSGNWTLSTTGSGASNEARKAILIPTGTPGVSRNILAPNSSKAYIVDNQSNAAVVLKGVTGPTTGITIATGEKCLAAWSGSDFVKVSSSVADGVTTIDFGTTGLTPATATSGAVTVAGTLAPANGGTGVANNAAMTVTGSGNFAYTRTLTATTNVTFPTTGTLSTLAGSETFTNKTLTNPTVTNYVESVVAIGTVTSSNTLSLTSGTVQTVTLTASTACTFTMPTATAGKSFILIVTQAAGGSGTAVFTSVKFPGGVAPTITATASAIDILTFVANGTSWFGTYAQAFA
jgi:hypothetical protein